MSTIAAWKCFSVNQFIDQCNWQNAARQALATTVPQPKRDLTSWRCLTTEDFFTLSNWSGRTVPLNSLESSAIEQVAFGLTLGSGEFWQCFNWSGAKKTTPAQKIEQVLEQTKEAIAEVEEFTLNNLSQLF